MSISTGLLFIWVSPFIIVFKHKRSWGCDKLLLSFVYFLLLYLELPLMHWIIQTVFYNYTTHVFIPTFSLLVDVLQPNHFVDKRDLNSTYAFIGSAARDFLSSNFSVISNMNGLQIWSGIAHNVRVALRKPLFTSISDINGVVTSYVVCILMLYSFIFKSH